MSWTEITSGDITGFVKNDYLLYGRDVIGLADHYGYEGVATTWDDVKLFSAENADSDVMDVLETGAYFILLQDRGTLADRTGWYRWSWLCFL